MPWNFPLQLALRSIAPALAAGCTVIAKPASWTPLSLLAWAKAMDEADTGLPSGVLQVLTGSGALAGDALAGHAGVDGVVLTGGVPTGRAVMAKASEQLTPVTLELGGKGANIVFPDANLRYAAKAICFGIFMNAGQMCWAGSRLLVHEDIHDELVEAVCAEVGKWPVGPGMEEGVRMGSLVHERHRAEVLEKLEAGLKKAVNWCSVVRRFPDGAFMEATVVSAWTVSLAVPRRTLRTRAILRSTMGGPELANDTPFGCSTVHGWPWAAPPLLGASSAAWSPSTNTPSPSPDGVHQFEAFGSALNRSGPFATTRGQERERQVVKVRWRLVEQHGRRVIEMAGQASTQSFSMAFLPTIADAIDAGLKDPATTAMVLTGDGRFFSAGADINAFQEAIDSNTAPELIRNLTGVLHPLLMRIRTSSTIVVAALNGVSAGGGLGLALACDARVGTPDARMAASYAGMGLSHGGTTWLLHSSRGRTTRPSLLHGQRNLVREKPINSAP